MKEVDSKIMKKYQDESPIFPDSVYNRLISTVLAGKELGMGKDEWCKRCQRSRCLCIVVPFCGCGWIDEVTPKQNRKAD